MGISIKNFFSKTSKLLEYKQCMNNQVSNTGSGDSEILFTFCIVELLNFFYLISQEKKSNDLF